MTNVRDGQARRKPKRLRTDVGYKRPPPEHRFRKGVSGNPRGRPGKSAAFEGSLAIQSMIIHEGRRRVSVVENGVKTTMPATQAIARRLLAGAVAGDAVAVRRFLATVHTAEQKMEAARLRKNGRLAAYKERWTLKILDCRCNGDEEPDPVPHPDDMMIDPRTDNVTFNGPATTEEKGFWDKAERKRAGLSNAIEWLVKQRKSRKGPFYVAEIEKALTAKCRELATLDHQYPSASVRRQSGFNLEKHREEALPQPLKGERKKRSRASSKEAETKNGQRDAVKAND